MNGARNPSKPTFFWQAALILLPVVLLTIFALLSLRQDRATVEREARERASETLDALAASLGTRAGVDLALAQLRNSRQQKFLFACSQWHVSQDANLLFPYMGDTPMTMSDAKNGTDLLSPEEGPAPDLVFDLKGNLIRPSNEFQNPIPPSWYLRLNQDQRAAWDQLCSKAIAGGGTNEIEHEVSRFLDTSPPPHAQAAAQYLRLGASLAGATPADALAQWLRFGDRCGGVLPIAGIYQPSTNGWQDAESDAGLPLATLATLEAIRTKTQRHFVADEWQAVVREVWFRPSLLTEPLLECVEARAGGHDPYRTYVQRMRQHLEYVERIMAVADVLRRKVRFSEHTTNCLWIDSAGEHWLCILQPSPSTPPVGSSTSELGASIPQIGVFLYSKTAVTAAFSNALQTIKGVSPIPYLAPTFELEGELISAPMPWANPSAPITSTQVFASVQGRLHSPAFTWEALRRGPPFNSEFDALPSHPRFTLELRLVDPGLMYAAQRRRAWLSAGLVAAAALAAVIGLFAAWRSFTRQQELAELKSNFVSSVSHELRAPIASVRLLAESLERGKIQDVPKQKEYFHFIVQECRRLSSLIENVLDFSRIEQGRKQYEFEPTEMGALMNQTVKVMQPYAEEKGVALVCECLIPGRSRGDEALTEQKIEPPHVVSYKSEEKGFGIELNVDGKAIQQALVNLIDNAIKHSPKGGTVTVGLEMENAECRMQNAKGDSSNLQPSTFKLVVQDDGPGIPVEEHERIFERFYRSGSELRRETQGVGIGLSIVKHIVEAHGGRVEVRSAAGQGSRFTIRLPANTEQPQMNADEHR